MKHNGRSIMWRDLPYQTERNQCIHRKLMQLKVSWTLQTVLFHTVKVLLGRCCPSENNVSQHPFHLHRAVWLAFANGIWVEYGNFLPKVLRSWHVFSTFSSSIHQLDADNYNVRGEERGKETGSLNNQVEERTEQSE